MKKILLTSLNAKYIHASLGLRYLYANLAELQNQAKIREFTIHSRPSDIVETILSESPSIVGFGIYIWNINETAAVVAQLRLLAPHITLILGGPEISYEPLSHPISQDIDYILTGPADISFYQLCQQITQGRAPIQKVINSAPIKLHELELPYTHYDAQDIAHRLIYVEASRGCPFKCEFCLSALDKTAKPFDQETFLAAIDQLYQRGARHFKFVDRTFNLKVKNTLNILHFFLQRLSQDLFLHFEVIPDHLPDALKEVLVQFAPGQLQFEVGIQSFTPYVQEQINRKQNNEVSKKNLLWLRENTHAHIHADLIFGLPGETLETFADSFNQLVACRPHEIQLGILKRLKGSPIIRHTQAFELIFNPQPPYNILSNKDVSFETLQRVNRFARYWDLIANSGRFSATLPLLLSSDPFNRFMSLSDWLYQQTGQTHKIHLKRLFTLIASAVAALFAEQKKHLYTALEQDFINNQLKGSPLSSELETEAHLDSISKRSLRQQRHRKEG